MCNHSFVTTSSQTSDLMPINFDYVIWYARDQRRSKFRRILQIKRAEKSRGTSKKCRALVGRAYSGVWLTTTFNLQDVSSEVETSSGDKVTRIFQGQDRPFPGLDEDQSTRETDNT